MPYIQADETPEGPDPTPDAREHQEKLLTVRLQDAEEQIGRARTMLAQWEPVAASCTAGLEALHRAQPKPEPA